MPVPWGGPPEYEPPQFPVAPIADVACRSMTLQQLRDMREFIKRLCKAGVLRYPDDRSAALNGCCKGDRICWSKVNQYDITRLVIKNIIPQDRSCSWAEMVAQGRAQPPTTFVSHWWGESFRDFMCAIEHHAREVRAQINHGYWFCVCADNQWSVEIGDTLEGSPFYQALCASTSTLLMLDRDGRVRTRAWCVWEWDQTCELGHELQVGTSLGLVGSALVSSGPFVDSLQGLRTSEAQASDPGDLRRILNHIAGIDERRGLLEVASEGGERRLAPDPAFGPGDVYECMLRKKHGQCFQELDSRVLLRTIPDRLERRAPSRLRCCRRSRRVVPAQSQLALPSSRRCRVEDPELRAVTLAQLRSIAEYVKVVCCEWDPACLEGDGRRFSVEHIKRTFPTGMQWETVDMHAIVKFLVKPATMPHGCSYMEMVADGPLPCQYHVHFVWGSSFRDFMTCLEWLAEARELPDSTAFWVSSLALDRFGEDLGDASAFARSIRSSNGIVVICTPEHMICEQIWAFYDWHLAASWGKSLDFLCASGALAATRPFATGCWEFGRFDPKLAGRLVRCRCESACSPSFVALDREEVMRLIDGADGSGIRSLNARVHRKAAGPLLREGALRGDVDGMAEVLRLCPGLRFGSGLLKGNLGEAPLHLAAASGQLSALEFLLNARADANEQDLDGETPLHYAALAAQGEAVRWLLGARADPSIESFYSEAPREVAAQRPAYFLGLAYDGVHTQLRAALLASGRQQAAAS